MRFRIELELLLQSISEVLHFRQVAAFVIFQHPLEDIDIEKRSKFKFVFGLWIGCVSNVAAKFSESDLFCIFRSYAEAIVARCRGQIEKCVPARTGSNCFSYF